MCRACADKGLPEPIPWERRRELGRIRAFLDTSKVILRSPTAFYRTPPVEDGLIGAAIYGITVFTLGQLVWTVMLFGLFAIASVIFGAAVQSPEIAGIGAGYSLCWMFLAVPLTLGQAPIQSIFGMLAGGGLTHLSLRLFKSTGTRYEGTLRAIAFANAPYILYAIPFLGVMIAWFWVVYLEVIGVREAHGIGTDKAALAVIGWRVLLFVAIVTAYLLLGAGLYMLDAPR